MQPPPAPDPGAARSPESSQFVPLEPRWFKEISAPPSGPPVVSGEMIVVSLQPAGIVALRTRDGSIAWQSDLTADQPVASDADRIYIATPRALHALSLTTGEEAWRLDTGTLTAPPLVHSGWLIAATIGSLAAVRASDGSVLWRQHPGTIQERPAIDGDRLFVPTLEGGLAALDLQTGETRWDTALGGSPGEPFAIGGKVYLTAGDKRFYAVDAESGDIDWPVRVGAAPRGRPTADEDHVYFVALDNVLRALDRGDGALEWSHGLPYRPAAVGPVRIDGALIVPGPIASLPVFGRNGRPLGQLKLPATLVAVSNVTVGEFNRPVLGVVTGDLQHPWIFSLLETSTAPPPIPLVPLSAAPGVSIPVALPR